MRRIFTVEASLILIHGQREGGGGGESSVGKPARALPWSQNEFRDKLREVCSTYFLKSRYFRSYPSEGDASATQRQGGSKYKIVQKKRN